MTVYYVDDGGSETSPYDTWAKAATTLAVLEAAVTLGSGDIVYVGHDSVDGSATSIEIDGPAATILPCFIISATQGSNPPTYQAGSAAHFGTTSTVLTLDGSFALYGMNIHWGTSLLACNAIEASEGISFYDCKLSPGANSVIRYNGDSGPLKLRNCTIDLSQDGTTSRSNAVFGYSSYKNTWDIDGLSFINAGYRTGEIFEAASHGMVSGCDFSGFTNGTTCEILKPTWHSIVFRDCKTAATWSAFTSDRPAPGKTVTFVNCGPSHAPTALIQRTLLGDLVSTASVYRTGGAQIEDIATAWLVTTESTCSEGSPFALPWLYGILDATGSTTFTVHISNDTADMTDAECWLEIEYLETSGSPLASNANDSRIITATPVAQADDTSSTWNGTGPSFTYKQTLSVTATVGQAGQYRARVVVGKASIASSAYFYVDPLVVVS